MNLVRQLPLTPGVNHQIFIHLKSVVSDFKNVLDKNCVLLYDEISLAAGIQYCESEDRIIGLQDLGNNNRTLKFADKALTFMVRGVKRKFKQPVAFNLTESGIKTPDLVVALKEIIRAVQSTGLKI